MTVQTRNVYYFSGFDPRGASYYLRLFRAELRKYGYPVGARGAGSDQASDPLIRQVASAEAIEPGAPISSAAKQANLNLFLMKWDDIVRCHWLKSTFSLIAAGFAVYRNGPSNISLRQVWRISHGAFWAGLIPLLSFVLALLSLTLIFLLAKTLLDLALPASFANRQFASLALAAVAAILAARSLAKIAEKTGVFWLVRIFRFNLLFATGQLPEIEERQQAWVESIIRRQTANPSDEIVLVGHSVGTIVMMEVAKHLLADSRWSTLQSATPTKIVTLGNCIPFISLHPKADRFRRTLHALTESESSQWWDITAKVDPLCFYRSSPLGETRKQKPPTSKPDLRAARFFRMYEPDRWKKMRRDKLGLHFLYLMNPDIDCDFNLYRLICGTQPLEAQLKIAAHA